MKGLKRLVLSVIACMMLITLAGCSSKDSDKSKGNAAEEKVFRFGQANPKEGVDIQKSTNSGVSSVIDNVVESLMRWNDDNEEECVLITDFPTISEDGLTYSFELKKDIKFSNGDALTSQDVKYTFERMFTPETGAKSTYMYDMIKGAKDMLAGTTTELAGIEIQDDTHFTITLDYKFAPFTANMGMNYAVIYPKDACEKAGADWGKGTNLIGTGPYVITENDEMTKVVMKPNETYHMGKPNLDRLEIVYIDDLSTKMMEYEKGNIDMCDLDSSLLDQYSTSLKDEITQVTPLGTNILSVKVTDEALNDAKVREAISLAINRKELSETVLNGAAEPASSFLNPQVPGHDDSLDTYEYNVDKAKKLLAEAGASNLQFTCKVRSREEKVATAIQGYLKEAGITMNVEVIDNGIWTQARSEGALQATIVGWYPLYADGDNQMYTYYYSENAVGKGVFYNNAEFDALMTEARQSVGEEEKRTDLYKQADYILSRKDYGTIPLYYSKLQFVSKPYVKNAKLGNLVYHLYNIDIDLDVKNK